jgi:hypothetical protein
MEKMKVKVLEISGRRATVEAIGARRVDGEPEAVITLRIKMREEGASESEARSIALMYLDPA